MTKPLSKSRFKIGAQCPTKLYYSVRKEYANASNDNEFLKALAEGGFQVGELAQEYHPGGTKVETLDYDEAIRQTDELLQKKDVIIYEAAFRHENLFIRVDVLVKSENNLELTEVKAKSFDSTEDFQVFAKPLLKKGIYQLTAKYYDYLLDLAFQTYVLRLAKPKFKVNPGLMLADKSKVASVDALNQLFLIRKGNDGRAIVEKSKAVKKEDLGVPVLSRIDLSDEIDQIIDQAEVEWAGGFKDLVQKLASNMKSGERANPVVGQHCKTCEFRVNKSKLQPPATKSGFEECWSFAKNLKPQDFEKELVLDVWDFRSSQKALDEGKVFAAELTEGDLKLKERDDDRSGRSRTERQLIQVEFAKGERRDAVVLADALSFELKQFKKPYHFIDFETTMVAIPFHRGRKPYEQMAYQFSHHVVDVDGNIAHKTEYLDDRRGVFPNFDFVRALRNALEGDDGVIFRFAAHENTVLNQIHQQLSESREKDRDELMKWIESITTPPEKSEHDWTPTRQFVDMRELTLRYYYLPETRGSNSIKNLLPAILNYKGKELQNKFPGYIIFDELGRAKDPYKMLPPIFPDFSANELEKVQEWLTSRDELNDGGAAMMAWGRMQFTEMSNVEHKALREALLRYCKLDTLAMVMIWEWWQLEIKEFKAKAA